jgi:hypothetical protein
VQNEVAFRAVGVVEVELPRGDVEPSWAETPIERAAAWTRPGPNAPQIGFT